MDVLEPGIESEMQLPPSCSCGNAGSFDPLRQAGDGTHASGVTGATAVGFLTHCTTVGTPCLSFYTRGKSMFSFKVMKPEIETIEGDTYYL